MSLLPTAALISASLTVQLADPFTYHGMCDASAAAALGEDLFVVANDERNQLKVYRHGEAHPIEIIDLSAFLGTKIDKESDLEGAATVGERIYWISSHGRNRQGEVQERRRRFFATDRIAGKQRIATAGRPYADLLDDIINADSHRAYDFRHAASLSPELPGAFNIEGLAATPDGELLIGLRNPVPRKMALLLHLRNPAEVIAGRRAIFGQPIELDLGGLAVRSVELVGLAYMIVAGPSGDAGHFALYQWSGDPRQAPLKLTHADFAKVRPEALFAVPGTRRIQLLSDDGGSLVKYLPEALQTFRSLSITL